MPDGARTYSRQLDRGSCDGEMLRVHDRAGNHAIVTLSKRGQCKRREKQERRVSVHGSISPDEDEPLALLIPGVRKCFSRQPRRIFLSTLGATVVARRRVNNSGKVLARGLM